MYCKYCGNKIPDGANFCHACGSMVDGEVKTPDYVIGAERPKDSHPSSDEIEKRDAHARKILTLGICSLAFTITGIFALVGIILACVCRSNIKTYEERYGSTTGIATIGKGLSLGGLIGGIVYTVFFTIYFLFIFLMVIGIIASTYDSAIVEYATIITNEIKFIK